MSKVVAPFSEEWWDEYDELMQQEPRWLNLWGDPSRRECDEFVIEVLRQEEIQPPKDLKWLKRHSLHVGDSKWEYRNRSSGELERSRWRGYAVGDYYWAIRHYETFAVNCSPKTREGLGKYVDLPPVGAEYKKPPNPRPKKIRALKKIAQNLNPPSMVDSPQDEVSVSDQMDKDLADDMYRETIRASALKILVALSANEKLSDQGPGALARKAIRLAEELEKELELAQLKAPENRRKE